MCGHGDPFAIGSHSSLLVLCANKDGHSLGNSKNATSVDKLILPDGQITSCFPKWPVQPLSQKYFPSRLTQITFISLTVSFRQEGRIARRHERGAGCGGRKGVRRARQSQGEMNLVSEFAACKMIGA
jgi:hypothetical protein